LSATLLDGAAVARELLRSVAVDARAFEQTRGRKACLATVLVGDDPASHTYVRMKANRCRAAGLDSRRHDLPAHTDTADVVGLVRELSVDTQVDGILVQHPMPSHINEREVFDAIVPSKDVDGVTTASFAAMSFSEPGFASCTPAGIIRLLDAYEVPLAAQEAVIVGRSPILGKPVGMLLLARDATVTFCHSKTADLAEAVRRADIVVAAVGRPELIRGNWIKPGAVVIDAGYNAGNVGDVEYAAAAERARLITPVPGGVGPMTIAVLLAQTVQAALASNAD
jgi:methylenetetrahydrofolate dehydrogenase (NADP+) / methenyltetrahydrofolate cyclohydrolase